MTDLPGFEHVTLFRGVGSVLARFQFTADTHPSGSFLFGLWGRSADGEVVRQFGVKFLDGERVAYFVFDHNAVRQDNETTVPTENQREVLVPWSSDPFDELGPDPQITAYLTIEGIDVIPDFPVEVIA